VLNDFCQFAAIHHTATSFVPDEVQFGLAPATHWTTMLALSNVGIDTYSLPIIAGNSGIEEEFHGAHLMYIAAILQPRNQDQFV